MPGSLTVLIVDDRAEDRVAFARYLRQAVDRAYSCIEAETAAQGLAMCQATPPDCVVLDYNLPDMDGLELTKEIMRRFPCPILVISTSVHPENTQNVFQLLEAGAIDVLPKPRAGLEASSSQVAQELISKIKIISGVVPLTRFTPAKPLALA